MPDSQPAIDDRATLERGFLEQLRLPAALIECTLALITVGTGEAFRPGRMDSELIKAQRGLD